MGARKGQNNFEAVQAAAVQARKLLINHALKSIKKGISFRTVNTLVVYVAERTRLHRTTISRNPEYMQLLLNYFVAQPGSVELIADDQADSPTLRAKLLACRTRMANVEAENHRLRATIKIATGVNGSSDSVKNEADQDNIPFTNTSMALLLLLERLHEKDLGIGLDASRKQIVDITELGTKRAIVGPQRLHSFFDWLSMTRPILENEMKLLSAGSPK